MERSVAVDHVRSVIETLNSALLPVPVTELWVFGDLALGLDPIDRLDLYLTKEVLLGGSPAVAAELETEFDVTGLGTVVHADWAREYPEHISTNHAGYVAPERCLASQLLPDDEPIHLEVCNAGFEDNVTQRLVAAIDRDSYEQLLDPRAVLVWREGESAHGALERLEHGDYVFPTLAESLVMLGMDQGDATDAAAVLDRWKVEIDGPSVRGDVV